MGKSLTMCGLGGLWQYEAPDALSALAVRPSLMKSVREHQGWDLDDTSAQAIYTELVGNVIRHTTGPILARLECDGSRVNLIVEDRGAGFAFEPRLPSSDLDEGGRGLFIVSKLAAYVRVDLRSGGGSTVIATLRKFATNQMMGDDA